MPKHTVRTNASMSAVSPRQTIGQAVSARNEAISKARAGVKPSNIVRQVGASIFKAISKFEADRGNPNVGIMRKDRFSPKKK